MRQNKYLGFGLVELLVTLTVGAILLTVAVPSFRSFVQNNRAVALTNELVAAINYARTEAVTRATPVSVCPSANTQGTACASAPNWDNGWIIFTDQNDDGILNSVNDRLKVHQSLEPGSTINTTVQAITFSDSGFVNRGAGQLQLRPSGCYGNHGRTLSLGATGRIDVNSASCS